MRLTIITVALLAIASMACGFTITLTGDYYVPSVGDADSGRVVTIARLPIDTSFYSITTYASGEDFVVTSEAFWVADSSWDTVAIDFINGKKLDIYTDDEISIYLNDTTGANPVYLPDNKTFTIDNLQRRLARLIIYAADSARVYLNVYGESSLGVK